jgi:predicted acylesterase/phospholipase RssA
VLAQNGLRQNDLPHHSLENTTRLYTNSCLKIHQASPTAHHRDPEQAHSPHLLGLSYVVRESESPFQALSRFENFRWMEFLDPEFGNGGLLSGAKFVDYLQQSINRSRFEELEIPLKIVAADFWNRTQVVFERGDLAPALQASIAIPGLFTPVIHDGRALVGGSAVNPVPYDLVQ